MTRQTEADKDAEIARLRNDQKNDQQAIADLTTTCRKQSERAERITERLQKAAAVLTALIDAASNRYDYDEQKRMSGKLEGVKLALSYIEEENKP